MAAPENKKRSRSQSNAASIKSKAAAEVNDDFDIVTDNPNKKAKKTQERRSLFVRSLPPNATSESLTDFFSEHYPVKHATVVVDKETNESRGFGFVTFADADDALEAKKALDKHEWEGRRIRIDVAEPRQRDAAAGPKPVPAGKPPGKDEYVKLPKLIIRNLPWSIKKPEQLSKLFQSFGLVKYADLPQDKGKLKGFGFVTLRGKPNAEKALKELNGKMVDGRPIAVDWAVDKQTYDKQKKIEEEEDATSSEGESDDDDDEEDEDEDEEEEKAAGSTKKAKKDDDMDEDLKNFMKNHMMNMEDEEDEDEDEDEEDEDDIEEDEDEDDDEEGGAKLEQRQHSTNNDATVFIRNLPYTATDASLKNFFSHFGDIRYARVVMDKTTGNPAGTGFVCFVNQADAKACITNAPRSQGKPAPANKTSILLDENADPEGKYTLDGRLLSVAQAVSKDDAGVLADTSLQKRHEKDKRRLYLLNEGSIGKNEAMTKYLTHAEIEMRRKSALQRKKMVQSNPSLHISLTRLALRNLPKNFNSKDLKQLARTGVVAFARDVKEGRRQPLSKEENARDGKDAKEKEKERKLKGKGIVRQAKIIFESASGSKVPEASGAGKSRGYGFIEYVNHHWALMGLRYLNGHQLESENGKKQRLIVEFAIENANVVQRRQNTEAKSTQESMKARAARKEEKAEIKEEKKQAERDARPLSKRQQRKAAKKGARVAEAKRKAAEREGKGEGVEEAKEGGKKDEMQQRLIARKRLMKKKKGAARRK